MFEQHEAIVKLLRDNDPATVHLLKNQLVDNGPDIIGNLRELAAIDDATVSGHAHDILAEIESRAAYDEFTLLCHPVRRRRQRRGSLLAAGARFPARHRDGALPAQARLVGTAAFPADRQRHLHPRTRRHPDELPRQRPRLSRQFRRVLRCQQLAAAQPDRLEARHPDLAGAPLHRHRGPRGHQGRGD